MVFFLFCLIIIVSYWNTYIKSYQESFNTEKQTFVLLGDSILKNNAYVSDGKSVENLLIERTNNRTICLAIDHSKIIDVYSQLDFDQLIATKIDETNSLGVIFEALSLAQKPLSYVTVGQDVPEDIEIADNKKLIDNIIEGVKL